jgi:hypothetical protein
MFLSSNDGTWYQLFCQCIADCHGMIAKIICWWQVLSLIDLPIKLMEKIVSWFWVY